MKILEAPEVMASEFRMVGETHNEAFVRAGERIFQEYSRKVDEVSYDSCTVT